MISFRCPLGDNLSSFDAGSGPHIDDMVGELNGLLVVLNHDDRIAPVPELLKSSEKLPVVP